MTFIRKQVEASLKEAEKDGVHVPQTLEEYTAIVQKQVTHSTSEVDDMLDYDDYEESSDEDQDIDDDDEDLVDDDDMNCEVDSGTA